MNSFEKAIEFVLKHEGGYVFDRDDPGGETKYGISKRAYPQLDIKSLTKEEAKAIYRRDYWEKIKGDELPFKVACVLLDSAVNCGVFKASLWFQMAIKQICKENIVLDGIIGKKTLKAFKSCKVCNVALFVIGLRIDHYISLNKTKYLKGWLRRVADLLKFIVKEGEDGCKGSGEDRRHSEDD